MQAAWQQLKEQRVSSQDRSESLLRVIAGAAQRFPVNETQQLCADLLEVGLQHA